MKTSCKLLLVILFVCVTTIGCIRPPTQQASLRKGIVLYPHDIESVGAARWVKWMKEAGLNLIGIHADTFFEPLPQLKAFLMSDNGQEFLSLCRQERIDVEFELHSLQNLLPREMFESHPEYFRMDSTGRRVKEYNMCFTNDSVYTVIREQLHEITGWLKPTTHRYFFWTDDVKDAFCQCDSCRLYSASEQALIYENRLLGILREIDPEATVAHLAYHNTLPVPRKVTPSKGVFLEYAPISRNYSESLGGEQLGQLQENLQVFPAATAHILEYWLDGSMFSDWKKDNLVELPWAKERCDRDVLLYKSLGVHSITSFAAWINSSYIDRYGAGRVEKVLQEYGQSLAL